MAWESSGYTFKQRRCPSYASMILSLLLDPAVYTPANVSPHPDMPGRLRG
jgi:hypothetical protein